MTDSPVPSSLNKGEKEFRPLTWLTHLTSLDDSPRIIMQEEDLPISVKPRDLQLVEGKGFLLLGQLGFKSIIHPCKCLLLCVHL